jgi:type IV secretory pathway VirB2 component (pilin)
MNASQPPVTLARALRNRVSAVVVPLAAVLFAIASTPAFACSACFGKSDSTMAKSVNAGIFSLMAVIVTVLVGAASFFVFLAHKASTTPESDPKSDQSSGSPNV